MPAFTANDLAAYQAAGGSMFGQGMPQKKKSNAWISFLPSALAAGASLIPGVGTAAAAGLGGVGELGRQVLSGEGVNIGKIGLEAGLSAIPGGIGKLGKLAKGGKGLVEGGEVAAKTGLLSKLLGSGQKAADLAKSGEAAANAALAARTGKAATGLGKLSVGTEARAGKTAAEKVIAQTDEYNRLAKESIQNLAEKNSKSGMLLGDGSQGVLVKKGATPSFASEGIEKLPTPDVPYAPTGKLLPKATKPTAMDAYGVPLPETTSSGGGLLSKMGGKVRGGNRGIEVGVITPGSGQRVGLTEARVKELNDVVDAVNTGKPGSVRSQVANIQKAKSTAQAEIDAKIAKANRATTSEELNEVLMGARKRVIGSNGTGVAGANTPEGQKIIAEFEHQLAGVKDVKGYNNFVKTMAKNERFGANPNSPDQMRSEIAKAFRKEADKKLTSLAPEAKAAKTQWSNLHEAETIMTKGANLDPRGIDLANVGGALSGNKGMLGGTFQAGRDAAGKTLQAVGSSKALPTYGRSLFGQLATRAVASPVTGSMSQPAEAATAEDQAYQTNPDGTFSPTDPTNMNDTFTASQAGMTSPSGGQFDPAAQQEDTGAQLMTAAKHALASGDSKGLENIMKVYSLYESMAKLNGTSKKPLSSEAAKTITNAETGLQAIQDFNGLITKNPGAFGRTGIPGVNLLDSLTQGRASGALGTSEINAASDQIVDVLARLRTGAAISKQEEVRFNRYIPRPGDSQKTIQQKLGYLNSAFQGVMERASGSNEVDPSEMSSMMAGAQ